MSRLLISEVSRDSHGFEDLDEFWSLPEYKIADYKNQLKRGSLSTGTVSSPLSEEEFNYEDNSSISDDDEDEDDDEDSVSSDGTFENVNEISLQEQHTNDDEDTEEEVPNAEDEENGSSFNYSNTSMNGSGSTMPFEDEDSENEDEELRTTEELKSPPPPPPSITSRSSTGLSRAAQKQSTQTPPSLNAKSSPIAPLVPEPEPREGARGRNAFTSSRITMRSPLPMLPAPVPASAVRDSLVLASPIETGPDKRDKAKDNAKARAVASVKEPKTLRTPPPQAVKASSSSKASKAAVKLPANAALRTPTPVTTPVVPSAVSSSKSSGSASSKSRAKARTKPNEDIDMEVATPIQHNDNNDDFYMDNVEDFDTGNGNDADREEDEEEKDESHASRLGSSSKSKLKTPPSSSSSKLQQKQTVQQASASKRRVSFGNGNGNKSTNTSTSSSTNNALLSPELNADKNFSTPSSAGRSRSRSSSSSARTSPGTVNTMGFDSAESSKSISLSTPGSYDFPRGRIMQEESYMEGGEGQGDEEEDDDEIIANRMHGLLSKSPDDGTDEEGGNDMSFASESSFIRALHNRKDKKRKSKAGIDDDNDVNELEHEEEEEEEREEEAGNVRRSRRAHRGQRFQFWKNERPVYQQGTLVGHLVAPPTPISAASSRAKATRSKTPKNKTKASKDKDKSKGSVNETEPLPLVVLPRSVQFEDRGNGGSLRVWNDFLDRVEVVKCVSHRDSMDALAPLPITSDRPKKKASLVGYAAQAFNLPDTSGFMSSCITGFVELPPGAIKDAEGVGECLQVFYVSDCQDMAAEFGIADPDQPEWNDATAERQLLRKGDSFYVPPGNIYRLENHSSVKTCIIYWFIVKPVEPPAAPVPQA